MTTNGATCECCGQETRAAHSLEMPAVLERPIFVYGNLKPGELGHSLISDHLSDTPEEATVEGALWVRDGMPMLRLDETSTVEGFLLRLNPEGYSHVVRFEPRTHYEWATTAVRTRESSTIEANVLVTIKQINPDSGGAEHLFSPWSTADDPLFVHGLTAIRRTLDAEAGSPIHIVGGTSPDWERFYRTQSAFMLTCAVLERIAGRVIAGKGTTSRVNALGRTEDFVHAVKEVGPQNFGRTVFSAANPSRKATLNKPEQFAQWAYQIRNNVMHQGKSASGEAELVRTSAQDLHDVLRVYLKKRVAKLPQAWGKSDPDGADSDWLVKSSLGWPQPTA